MTLGNLFDLRQLEAFAAVMSTGSVTAAARIIGKSQPVVTRLIQDLESDLGFDLFARHARRIMPTQNGALFYREVERLLHDAALTRQRAQDIARRQVQALEVVATASLGATIVPRALRRLQAAGALPPSVTVRTLAPEDVIQTVAARGADIGIASMPLDHPGAEVHWIAEAACVCVLPADDPLAARPAVDLADLAERPLITLSNPYRVLGRISAAMNRAHLTAPGVLRTNSSTVALQMVRAGLGIAILEPLSPVMQETAGVVARPLTVQIPYLWGIITPVGLAESPAVAPLIQAMIGAAGEDLPGFQTREPRDMETILKTMQDLQQGEP